MAKFTDSQIGRAARSGAEYAMSISINGDGTELFVVYGAKVRRVDAGDGWASRLWDAMRKLRPEISDSPVLAATRIPLRSDAA